MKSFITTMTLIISFYGIFSLILYDTVNNNIHNYNDTSIDVSEALIELKNRCSETDDCRKELANIEYIIETEKVYNFKAKVSNTEQYDLTSVITARMDNLKWL